jgi:adenylate cyclase
MHDVNREKSELPAYPTRDVEAEFSRRMLASEQWHSQILFFLLLILLLLHLCLPLIGPVWEMIRDEARPLYRMGALVIAAAASFELYCVWVCHRYLRQRRIPLGVYRYLNALIETSFPTLGLFAVSEIVSPIHALYNPVASTYYFFILLAALRLDFFICLFTGMVAAVGYFSLFLSVRGSGLELDQAMMVTVLLKGAFLLGCGVLSGLVAQHIRQNLVKTMEVVAEKREVVGIFSQLVSPQVAQEILHQHGGVGSEIREVTILVVDIRNFTSLAEITPPDDLVEYLNVIWESGVRVVNHHGGIINKFLGDGFMAVFGAPVADPQHAEKAVWAGLNLLGEMTALHDKTTIPETRLGIGIHSGPALLGVVGTKDRREYTVIGDTVNVAFRIEQLNKEFDSQLLISEAVKRRAGEIAREAELLPHMFVKGRSGPVQAYRIV